MAARAGSDTPNQPPWTAKWCWTAPRSPRPWNAYACFRRVVDLPARALAAVVRVTADARYALFVNGRRIHFGPARSFPAHQSFDTLDLADFLVAGPNAICAIVHQPGVPTAQSVYRDASGFLLDGVVQTHADAIPLHTPGAWQCRDARGWRKHVARTHPDLGFQEHFDADADPADWMSPDYSASEEAGWKPPVVVSGAGGYPWVSLEPRRAPLLTDTIVGFKSILAQFTGENARGYKVAEDVYHLATQETRKKTKPVFDAPDALLRDDDQFATLPPPADGHFHLATFDLGQVHTGHVALDLADAAGDEIIDVLYLRDVDKTGGPVLALADQDAAPADRCRCRPGPQRWETFWPKAFRHLALIFRNVEQPLRIRHIHVRAVHADLAQAGRFETSDDTLNAIYNAGVATLRAATLDALVDAPDVSQAQQWNAADVTARAIAIAFGDLSLFERGIRQLGESQAADGSLHSHPPSDDPHARTLDAMFTWVATLWQHYSHSGQTDLLRRHHDAITSLLTFLRQRQGDNELIVDDDGVTRCLTNLRHLQCLRTAAAINELLKSNTSAILTSQADALANALDQFWDDKLKGWRDEIGPANNQSSAATNALAVLLNLRPDAHEAVARDVVLKSLTARRGKVLAPAPAPAALCLDALVKAGLRAQAIDVIRTKWGGMIERGATTFWETWDGTAGSRCHGPATSPVYLFPQLILGVTSAVPGWRQIRIAPVAGGLEFARGAVPTPAGIVRIEWERAGEDQLAVRVELPDGVEAEFVSPLGETRQLDGGASEFHT